MTLIFVREINESNRLSLMDASVMIINLWIATIDKFLDWSKLRLLSLVVYIADWIVYSFDWRCKQQNLENMVKIHTFCARHQHFGIANLVQHNWTIRCLHDSFILSFACLFACFLPCLLDPSADRWAELPRVNTNVESKATWNTELDSSVLQHMKNCELRQLKARCGAMGLHSH
jgi:hypothetical protein